MNMKKSLIALAVAGAFVAPAAMAADDTTVYGQINMSAEHQKSGGSPSTKNNALETRESRIGFKGAEDLGNGMSVIWQIESAIDADDGTGTLASRNTFLGLKSDAMGTLLAGKHDTPYKMATRKLDVFDSTAADNREVGMGSGHDARLANTLVYKSPEMGGVSIAASTVFGAETANGLQKGSALSLAAMFNMDQIYGAVAYQSLKAGDVGTGDLAATGGTSIFGPFPGTAAVSDKANAIKVGGGFGMDVFTVNAVIERLTYKVATGGDTKNTNIYVGGKFNVSPSDAVKVAFTKIGNSKSGGVTTTDGSKQMSVGYDHGYSANTVVYALFSKEKTNSTAVGDPSVIALGVKHAF